MPGWKRRRPSDSAASQTQRLRIYERLPLWSEVRSFRVSAKLLSCLIVAGQFSLFRIQGLDSVQANISSFLEASPAPSPVPNHLPVLPAARPSGVLPDASPRGTLPAASPGGTLSGVASPTSREPAAILPPCISRGPEQSFAFSGRRLHQVGAAMRNPTNPISKQSSCKRPRALTDTAEFSPFLSYLWILEIYKICSA